MNTDSKTGSEMRINKTIVSNNCGISSYALVPLL